MCEEAEEHDSGPSNLDCIENNLWLGNLAAATDLELLEEKKINFILTVDSCPLPQKISDRKNIQTKYIQAFSIIMCAFLLLAPITINFVYLVFIFIPYEEWLLFRFSNLKVTDTPREDLLSHLEETFDFIENGLTKGVVLVHCYFGVSRSATIILAYVMKKKNMSLDSAYEYVKSKRRFIGPNPGFMAQLKLYETMKCKIDKFNVQYKMFRLYIAADYVKKAKIVPQCCADVVKNDPSLATVRPDPRVFRCKKCRRVVAQTSNIIPHMPKEKYSWRDSRWSDDLEKQNICSQTYFIEPLAWMENVSVSLEGKLHCPNANCGCKLGSFSWIMGKYIVFIRCFANFTLKNDFASEITGTRTPLFNIKLFAEDNYSWKVAETSENGFKQLTRGCQCPCGTKVSPGFYLIPSKVDKGNIVQNVQVTV